MKVILLEDVAKVGRKYEEHDVAPGFGRNFLIARGKARLPQEFSETQLKDLRERAQNEHKKNKEAEDSVTAELSGKSVTILAKASEEGHLFAGVKAEDIKEAVAKDLNIDIDSDLINLEHALKSVGSHKVKIGEAGELEVIIEAEK